MSESRWLFSWSDLRLGLPFGIFAALSIWALPLCVSCHSEVIRFFDVDIAGLYRMSAAVAGTMTSVSLAVVVMAVQLWKARWLADFLQRPDVVENFWGALFRFTWGAAAMVVVSGVGFVLSPGSHFSDFWVVLYASWLGVLFTRFALSVYYLRLLVAMAVAHERSAVERATRPLDADHPC